MDLGRFTAAQIREKLASGEVSRMHQIETSVGWISAGEFVDRMQGDDRAVREVRAREQRMQRGYEEQLEAARARERGLVEQMRVGGVVGTRGEAVAERPSQREEVRAGADGVAPHGVADPVAEPALGGGLGVGTLADAVSGLAGVDSAGGFRFWETFSQVFRRHPTEETELLLASGSTATTPRLSEVSAAFPQPWMFVRILGLALTAFGVLCYATAKGGNDKFIPGLIVLGALATPLAILVLFFEVNKPRNVSLYLVLKLVVVGGTISLLFTVLLHPHILKFVVSVLGLQSADGERLGWIAGLIEEPAKMLVLIWMVNKPRYNWTLNGLLFGAAVGTGFAVFETAGYAFEELLGGVQKATAAMVAGASGQAVEEAFVAAAVGMFQSLFVRGIIEPLGSHAVWTAIVGAGIWRAKREHGFVLDILMSKKFLGPFIAAMALHALWNALQGGAWKFMIFVGFAAWVIVIGLIREGLREIAIARGTVARVVPAPVPTR